MAKPSLSDLMETARKMQQSMAAAQSELEESQFTGVADKGGLRIHLDGRYHATSAHLDRTRFADHLSEADLSALEHMIVTAVNDAVQQVDQTSKGKIMALTQSLGIPSDRGDGDAL